MNTLETLEKLTHAWPQSEREELGRRFGIGWTALRYQGTASMEGLEFLYPFLNDSDAHVRRQALEAVGTIFRGTGVESLEKLSYVTENRDLFIRDRSSLVVGKALGGQPPNVILDILRPSYTHKNNFTRALGTLAVGLAGVGRAHRELLPVFQERIADRDGFVAVTAVAGMGEAFSESGNRQAINALEDLVPFPVVRIFEGEPQRSWHFRWRHAARSHSVAAHAIARIGRGSQAEKHSLELVRQYLRPQNVPEKMWSEAQGTQRQGVWAMTWLLRGKPVQALGEMRFLLPRPSWPRSAMLCSLPGTFADAGREGIELAMSLLDRDEHAVLRAGMLSVGVAARAACDEKVLAALIPFLSHGNGAVRDVANLAVGLAFHKSGRSDALKALQSANMDDRRGPSTNYPLGVGLLFQGSGDESVAASLVELPEMKRRRLTRHVALGVGLVYQGTSNVRAAQLLLPTLESKNIGSACEALQLVDFDEAALAGAPLAAFPRCHALADGPGAARMFVLKHFLDSPPSPLTF